MQYAPATHWDQVFHTFRHRGEDLDWGDQWTGAFVPILHTHHVQNLLDLGCGTGKDVLRLTQHGYTVVGLDHSREAVHQAATKAASRAAFLVADMAAPLPLADACFDAVMSNVAMHFFDDARTRRDLAPNYILETDGKTMHFFSAAYLHELLTGWREVHLELIEITARTTAIPRVAETLANPDKIVRSRTDTTVELFDRHYPSTAVTSKFLCTVVKVLPDDNFIITAY